MKLVFITAVYLSFLHLVSKPDEISIAYDLFEYQTQNGDQSGPLAGFIRRAIQA